MTRSEREHIIQRYLSGTMSTAEEGDFFVQVALDRELRHDLQAQQTIESAFRKDSEAERVGHTALRTRVASMLAASPPGIAPEHPRPAAVSAPPAEPPAPGSTPPGVSTHRWGPILGWSALLIGAIAVTIALLRPDPFRSGELPSPASAPVKTQGSTSISPRREETEMRDVMTTPDTLSARAPASSSPAIARPSRPAAQGHVSSSASREDTPGTVYGSSAARTLPKAMRPTTSLPPDHAVDDDQEGDRRSQSSERVKVGVRIKIKPQQ